MHALASRITFICPMRFNSFPMDVQVCTFQVFTIVIITIVVIKTMISGWKFQLCNGQDCVQRRVYPDERGCGAIHPWLCHQHFSTRWGGEAGGEDENMVVIWWHGGRCWQWWWWGKKAELQNVRDMADISLTTSVHFSFTQILIKVSKWTMTGHVSKKTNKDIHLWA